MNDTPREIAQMVWEKLMERPGAERVMVGSRMFEAARTMSLASSRQDSPRLKSEAACASDSTGTMSTWRLLSKAYCKAREKNDDA
ncbi:MAG: hypothetical protein WKF84_16940 [Pyrinomonadaceae bacterium]